MLDTRGGTNMATREYGVSTIRILIVDDDNLVLDYLREAISQILPESSVEATTSPRWALHCLSTEDYHVVLSDIEMPEMTGIDMMRQQMGHRPGPSFVLMTGDSTWLPLAVDAGAYACLPKPLELDLLNSVLRHAIDFNLLERRVERSRQVLALQTRTTNEYCEQFQERTVGLERRMAEMRRNELDQVTAVWAWH